MITLILLPGMLCDEGSWRAQIVALEDLCALRVATYGKLSTVTEMAQSIIQTAPSRFVVCGHSLGGRVAQEICRLVPERVAGLGLFGTDYRGPATETDRDKERQFYSAMEQEASALGMREYGRVWAKHLLPRERHGDEKLIDEIIQMTARHSVDHVRTQGSAGASRPDFGSLLPNIRCPALLCAGALDVHRPIAPLEHMAKTIPRGQLAIIPDAGHMMMMERPLQTSELLRGWLLNAIRDLD